MTERKARVDQVDTPEDVATLYSWANLHGTKYRDFSVSRALAREQVRLSAEEALAEEANLARERADGESYAEARRAAEVARAAETARQAEIAALQAAKKADRETAEEATRLAESAAQKAAAERSAREAESVAHKAAVDEQARQAELAALEAARQTELAARKAAREQAAREAELAAQAARQAEAAAQQAAQRQTWPSPDRFFPPSPSASRPFDSPRPGDQDRVPPPAPRPAPDRPFYAQARGEANPPAPYAWSPSEPAETADRPAWLAEDHSGMVGQPASQAPSDTLEGTRDRMTARWFALRSVFNGHSTPVQEPQAPVTMQAPVIAVFSLAGGVGKTSLVATLGRALSARGERVLLVDTAAHGLLPFFFGARDQRPGMLRTFSAPDSSGDHVIQMVTIDPDTLDPESASPEPLATEIAKYAHAGLSRVIVDLATASSSTTRRLMRMEPTVLVPVIPDMNSVVSVGSIEAFFQRGGSAAGNSVLPTYVLNQFDPTLPLHLEVREVLREQIGDRLLPFAIRRAPAVSEALAEGMTVMDYAPNSTAAEDFGLLAGWVKSQTSLSAAGYRRVRWRER